MTIHGTHAELDPFGSAGYVTDIFRPVPDHLRLMLGHLDGDEATNYSIWPAPDPESIVVRARDVGDSFMQAAGSADAMTIEARLQGPDGEWHLYTVGRQEPNNGETLVVPLNENRQIRIFTNEAFTADEAAVIFYTYYLTNTVSQPYQLRQLDLAHDQSEER